MTSTLHPTAIVGDGARIGPGCRIGPYVIIEPGAVVGAENELGAGCYIYGCVTLGDRNRLTRAVSLGGWPQSLGYQGEPTTLEVGDDNWFGENTTVHRGTTATGRTVIGSHNFVMVNTHIGHDVRFGDHIVTGPNVMVGGEAQVHSRANLGGGAGLHQFVRVGEMVMVGAMAKVVQDVLPFTIVSGEGALYGLNRVGIRRSGLPREHLPLLQAAYREFCVRRHGVEALRETLAGHPANPFSEAWLAFTAEASRRGYTRAVRVGRQRDEGASDE